MQTEEDYIHNFIQESWFSLKNKIGFKITGEYLTDPTDDPLDSNNKIQLHWSDEQSGWIINLNIQGFGLMIVEPKNNKDLILTRLSDKKTFEFMRHGYNKD